MSMLEMVMHPANLDLVYFCLLGVLASGLVSFLPALHIYNVLGIFLLFVLKFEHAMTYMQLSSLAIGMIVGYSILNTVPSTYLGPGDESMSYYVLPGAQWMGQGKGYESIILTGIGALGGLILLAALAPVFLWILPGLKVITSPHMFWILGAVIAYMILSEWPKGVSQSRSTWANFFEGWGFLAVGLATFLLSGLLGFIVMAKTMVPLDFAFQSITPVFVGLFALPWLITNIINIGVIPKQHIATTLDLDWDLFVRGIFSGFLGGFFAAFIPIVTAGVGGLMAGHATAQRDTRLFVMSYGTCKTVYYVGSFFLFFIPGLSLTRGGLAWILMPMATTITLQEYAIFVGLMLFAAGVSFLLLGPFTQLCISLVERVDYHKVSIVTMIGLIPMTYIYTGFGGLMIMTVATGIGLLPVMFQARRMNLMGVLLLPVCLNMAGYGNDVLRLLGLL
ncbi:MAG: tripartite tricarboxylate transporter permease [Candidatus Riflebacteria bacterium]|nr:tripartite tricarboxylate transporter permease [Candidatus Riflebacteria bacterium]